MYTHACIHTHVHTQCSVLLQTRETGINLDPVDTTVVENVLAPLPTYSQNTSPSDCVKSPVTPIINQQGVQNDLSHHTLVRVSYS